MYLGNEPLTDPTRGGGTVGPYCPGPSSHKGARTGPKKVKVDRHTKCFSVFKKESIFIQIFP